MTTGTTKVAAVRNSASGPGIRLFSKRLFAWILARLGSVLVAAGGLFVWWVVAAIYFVVPTPLDTAKVFVQSLGEPAFQTHLIVTADAVLWSVIASVMVGILLGLMFGMSRWLSNAFEPLVVALNGVPKIVLYPVLLLILGMGVASKITLATTIGMFPVFMNVAAGVRDMPPVYRKLSRSLDASRWQTFGYVIVPAIRKPLLTGMRLAVSLATVGVVLAEMFATKAGLGRVIMASHTAGQHARMFSTVLLLLAASFVLSTIMWRFERSAR